MSRIPCSWGSGVRVLLSSGPSMILWSCLTQNCPLGVHSNQTIGLKRNRNDPLKEVWKKRSGCVLENSVVSLVLCLDIFLMWCSWEMWEVVRIFYQWTASEVPVLLWYLGSSDFFLLSVLVFLLLGRGFQTDQKLPADSFKGTRHLFCFQLIAMYWLMISLSTIFFHCVVQRSRSISAKFYVQISFQLDELFHYKK